MENHILRRYENNSPMKKTPEIKKAKFIFNPRAGAKRRLNPLQTRVTLEDIKDLLDQYQIPVDYAPTQYARHAIKLAKDSIKEGYDLVIAAGGDGTVGEVINGLVGSDVSLGILPLGTVMNNARMLAIPLEIEKAVQLIKIRRERKIDVAVITKLDGEKLSKPYCFTEQAGLGLDAIIHQYTSTMFDDKLYGNVFRIVRALFGKYDHKAKITVDGEVTETRAILVTISNGPLGGPALTLAPEAKLNDHKLTVTLFNLTKYELARHLFRLFAGKKPKFKHIKTLQGAKIKIETEVPKMVHADARLFGDTPVEFKVIPNALKVITGFPEKHTSSFNKRTYLDL
jgi:diacylglycerol kinase (ATP)